MPQKASTLRLRFYRDDVDDASQAYEIIQEYGFHPTKYNSGPFGTGDRIDYNYQQYETNEENESLIDDIVEELDKLFQDMDVWSELKTHRDAGVGAEYKTIIYLAPDKNSI